MKHTHYMWLYNGNLTHNVPSSITSTHIISSVSHQLKWSARRVGKAQKSHFYINSAATVDHSPKIGLISTVQAHCNSGRWFQCFRNVPLKYEAFQEAFKCLLGTREGHRTEREWSCLLLPLRRAAQGRFGRKRVRELCCGLWTGARRAPEGAGAVTCGLSSWRERHAEVIWDYLNISGSYVSDILVSLPHILHPSMV